MELIFVQPYCRIQNVVDLGLVRRQTASNYLKGLTKIKVLRELKKGRVKIYVHPAFLSLLDSRE